MSYSLHRNCLLKHAVEGKLDGKIGVTGRRGRRSKQLPYDLRKAKEYWKLQDAPRLSLCKEMTLEQALDLSSDRLWNECNCMKRLEFLE